VCSPIPFGLDGERETESESDLEAGNLRWEPITLGVNPPRAPSPSSSSSAGTVTEGATAIMKTACTVPSVPRAILEPQTEAELRSIMGHLWLENEELRADQARQERRRREAEMRETHAARKAAEDAMFRAHDDVRAREEEVQRRTRQELNASWAAQEQAEWDALMQREKEEDDVFRAVS
jgi:hypothetical protein